MPRRPKTRTSWAPARKRSEDRRRGTAAERGYDGRWRKARRAFLSRPENVLCRSCASRGRMVEAECVDHVEPHKGDPVLFWDQTNWQPLCHACHSTKTAAEDGGFGNQRKDSDYGGED